MSNNVTINFLSRDLEAVQALHRWESVWDNEDGTSSVQISDVDEGSRGYSFGVAIGRLQSEQIPFDLITSGGYEDDSGVELYRYDLDGNPVVTALDEDAFTVHVSELQSALAAGTLLQFVEQRLSKVPAMIISLVSETITGEA